jgi:hypothetical protein
LHDYFETSQAFFHPFIVKNLTYFGFEITVAFLTSFGDYARAVLSNNFAQLAGLLAAKSC